MVSRSMPDAQFEQPGIITEFRWCVVITTFNRSAMLRRAIESCVNQTVDCEIVVVDDASTDDTADMVGAYPCVKYLRNNRSLGQSAASNIGMNVTTADWIKPLDDDDWLAPNCLEQMSKALANAHMAGMRPVMLTSRATKVDIRGQRIGETPLVSAVTVGVASKNLLHMMMLDQLPIGTPVQVAHSREAALRVGGWNEHRSAKHLFGGDSEFWIRLAGDGDAVFVSELLSFRTIWVGNCTNTTSLINRYLINLHLKDLLAAKLGGETTQVMKCYLALNWAFIALRERNLQQAIRLGLIWLMRPHSVVYFLYRQSRKRFNRQLMTISNLAS